MKKINKKRVFVAMSGGVDSSVAALLLKKQGYDVVGVFMKLCPSTMLRGAADVKRVCKKLNIPFLTWDFQKEFKKAVVDDFIQGYKKGITPNPCVVCNPEIKFGLFLKKALKEGADYIATGHYVRLVSRNISTGTGHSSAPAAEDVLDSRRGDPADGGDQARRASETFRTKHSGNLIFSLLTAKDKNKDQSYFLWKLNQEQLKHCLFPLGNYTKERVREIAKKNKLPVAYKKESQEICFIKDADTRGFLKKWIKAKKGEIIDLKTNKKIAEHQGAQFYTIGQRAPVGGTGPYYIIGKDLKKNKLFVIPGNDSRLFSKTAELKDVNWISGYEPKLPMNVSIKIRYQSPSSRAIITEIKKDRSPRRSAFRSATVRALFVKGQKAITPGQSAVFYRARRSFSGGGQCRRSPGEGGRGKYEILGGGIII